MRKIVLLLCVFLPLVAQAKWQTVYKEKSESIPFIFSAGSLCSGALIGNDLILTAWHCVSKIRPVYVGWKKDATKPSHKMANADVIALDKANDLAILRLHYPVARPVLRVFDTEKKLKEGEFIATIGHPVATNPFAPRSVDEGLTFVLSEGVVSKVNRRRILTDMSLSPGNSGGPIFNEAGEIVAVASAKRTGPAVGQIGFLISHHMVQRLFDSVKKKEIRYPASALNAEGDSYFRLTYSDDSIVKNELAKSGLLGFEFGFTILDRVRMSYGQKFPTETDLSYYQFGYSFYFEVTYAFQVRVIPHYGHMSYNFPTVSSSSAAYGVMIELANFGLSLDLTQIPNIGRGGTAVSLSYVFR